MLYAATMADTARGLPDPSVEPTLNVRRAAAILDISERGTYAAIERGEIPSIRIGRTVRVPTAEFLTRFRLHPGGVAA